MISSVKKFLNKISDKLIAKVKTAFLDNNISTVKKEKIKESTRISIKEKPPATEQKQQQEARTRPGKNMETKISVDKIHLRITHFL